MIRVLHARTGETLRHARARRPVIEAASVPELLQRLRDPETWNGLSAAEVEAVRQAAGSIPSRESVNILVAGGGSIFRIEKPDPNALAENAERPEPAPWLATERDALVLLVFAEPGPLSERVTEAVRFVGYDAEAVIVPALPGAAPNITARAPLVVVVHEPLIVSADAVAQVRGGWKPHGLVVLTAKAGDRTEYDGQLELPLKLDAIARTLDPLIAGARSRRTV